MTDYFSTHRDKHGLIPTHCFENEPHRGPRPLAEFMSCEALIEFFIMSRVIAAAAEKVRSGRVLH
jgi:hypothetical protein